VFGGLILIVEKMYLNIIEEEEELIDDDYFQSPHPPDLLCKCIFIPIFTHLSERYPTLWSIALPSILHSNFHVILDIFEHEMKGWWVENQEREEKSSSKLEDHGQNGYHQVENDHILMDEGGGEVEILLGEKLQRRIDRCIDLKEFVFSKVSILKISLYKLYL